jgi:plasmid stabilization system protein ParE
MVNRSIRWSVTAFKQFESAILYISRDSVRNAEQVRLDILESVERLADRPEFHPPDKFKTDNPGEYRAFELHRLRIAYYHDLEQIRILRVRHTSREPQGY